MKKLTQYWCCMPSTASFIQLLCLQETPIFSYFSYHTFKVCGVYPLVQFSPNYQNVLQHHCWLSRIDWVRHHLLNRESQQAVIMQDLQRAPWLAEERGHWLTHRGNNNVFRNMCMQNIQCAQNRLYRSRTALIVLQDGETRSNGPNN